MIQKAIDAINDNQKLCGVIFDIQKAFDKVWHSGLLYKMSKMNIPARIGNWIKSFLKNRKFQVKVDKEVSNQFSIEASVPQGAVLSSILFLIYINDIFEINQYPNDKIFSQLFADDLFSFNIDHLMKRLNIQMQRYLNQLENWLNKWRMSIAANKCSVTIYSKQIPKELKNGEFKLVINNKEIPINHEPTYLGVILDNKLNLNKHTDKIRNKCLKLNNILKCLSFKSWSLNYKSKINVYKCLIRSNMEYAAPITITSNHFITRLHGVQYQALKIVLNEKSKCSSKFLHDYSQLPTIDSRLHELSSKYLENAIINKNPLILEAIDSLQYPKGRKMSPLDAIGFVK